MAISTGGSHSRTPNSCSQTGGSVTGRSTRCNWRQVPTPLRPYPCRRGRIVATLIIEVEAEGARVGVRPAGLWWRPARSLQAVQCTPWRLKTEAEPRDKSDSAAVG